MGGLSEEAASKKVISILFLSICQAAQKTLLDKVPTTQIATITLSVLRHQYEQTFVVKRNRTPDRFRFFSRKHENRESRQQFWNALKGLTPKREFEGQTNSLVDDIFTLNMHKKAVQERLCTEPNGSPEDALQFAVAFKEGIEQASLANDKNRIQT